MTQATCHRRRSRAPAVPLGARHWRDVCFMGRDFPWRCATTSPCPLPYGLDHLGLCDGLRPPGPGRDFWVSTGTPKGTISRSARRSDAGHPSARPTPGQDSHPSREVGHLGSGVLRDLGCRATPRASALDAARRFAARAPSRGRPRWAGKRGRDVAWRRNGRGHRLDRLE